MNQDIERMLIEGNLEFQWKQQQGLENINGEGSIPKYPVLILTCMDPRIDVYRIFQLEPGDVFILRNAGNIITSDVIRSILIAIHKYNVIHIIILGHSDCGMTKISNSEFANKVHKSGFWRIIKNDQPNLKDLQEYFKFFIDEFKNLKDQVENLSVPRKLPHNIKITGMFYDVKTGWVFEHELIKEFTFIEQFIYNYPKLLDMKREDLAEFLNRGGNASETTEDLSNGDQGLPEKNKIDEENLQDNNLETDTIKTMNNITRYIPKINVPKINYPKIKVSIPNIYKKISED